MRVDLLIIDAASKLGNALMETLVYTSFLIAGFSFRIRPLEYSI